MSSWTHEKGSPRRRRTWQRSHVLRSCLWIFTRAVRFLRAAVLLIVSNGKRAVGRGDYDSSIRERRVDGVSTVWTGGLCCWVGGGSYEFSTKKQGGVKEGFFHSLLLVLDAFAKHFYLFLLGKATRHHRTPANSLKASDVKEATSEDGSWPTPYTRTWVVSRENRPKFFFLKKRISRTRKTDAELRRTKTGVVIVTAGFQ